MGADEYVRLISGIRLDLLELLGSEYVIEYCMSVLMHEAKKKNELGLLEYYITDCLKVITENTAKSVLRGDSSCISKRYADLVRPMPKEPEMNADDIVADIFKRAGLSLKEEVRKDHASV